MDSPLIPAVPTIPRSVERESVEPHSRSSKSAVLSAIGVALLALALYAFPGDWTVFWRGSQGKAVSEQLSDSGRDHSESLYADLERHLRFRPSDARALIFKARLDMAAQRYEQAAAGYERAVADNSKAARDPDILVEYAEARGMAQGRTLAGEPLKLVQKALAIDGTHPQALDLAGSAAWEGGDFAASATYWRRLLDLIPQGSDRHRELSRAIARAQQRAKVSLPPS